MKIENVFAMKSYLRCLNNITIPFNSMYYTPVPPFISRCNMKA